MELGRRAVLVCGSAPRELDLLWRDRTACGLRASALVMPTLCRLNGFGWVVAHLLRGLLPALR